MIESFVHDDRGFQRHRLNTITRRLFRTTCKGVYNTSDLSIFAVGKTFNTSICDEYFHLTNEGCERLVGGGYSLHIDAPSRILIWILPIFLLIINIELSSMDKRKFMTIAHALGDPLHSLASIIYKVSSLDRCHQLASRFGKGDEHRTRVIGTVFAGFEELMGSTIRTEEFYIVAAERLGVEDENKFQYWSKAALELADSRTNEIPRAILSIVLYIFQLTCSFVKVLGGPQVGTFPGGRVGLAMMISWLLPLVLLTNHLGTFTSRRTCLRIMNEFLEGTLPSASNDFSFITKYGSQSWSSWSEYFKALKWNGAIYTYQPWMSILSRRKGNGLFGMFLALASTVSGVVSACIILWYAYPSGFGCRHIVVLGLFFLWILSAFLTHITYRLLQKSVKRHWWFVAIKDCIIGSATIVGVIVSVISVFNSCYCWSLKMSLGKNAYVPTCVEDRYSSYSGSFFPIVVAVCIFIQISIYVTIIYVWRRGLGIVRWPEKLRRNVWELEAERWRDHHGNFLLFRTPNGRPRR